ncbi:hypothetical protein ACFX2C_037410 [Malus domestica]
MRKSANSDGENFGCRQQVVVIAFDGDGILVQQLFQWVRNCSRVQGEDKLDPSLWFLRRPAAVVGQTGLRVQVGWCEIVVVRNKSGVGKRSGQTRSWVKQWQRCRLWVEPIKCDVIVAIQ